MEIIISAFVSWFLAQAVKVVTTAFKYKKLTPYTFVASGGMPSSHTALVVSTAAAILLKEGINSPIAALSLVLGFIVIYDAMGVRRSVGEQAKQLSKLVEDFYHSDSMDNKQLFEKIGRILGHTPLEVAAGAILGILVAIAVSNMGC